MTTEHDQKEGESETPDTDAAQAALAALGEPVVVPDDGEVEAPREFGVERYVHATFFGLGLLSAYLVGKVLLVGWNSLADWPAAVRAVPALIAYTEEERGNFTLVIGAVLGVLLILRYYRRPAVRGWAMDVASELSKVTWPNREMVTNGTLIVLIAGAIATVYVTILDRFWGYLTNLVYGA